MPPTRQPKTEATDKKADADGIYDGVKYSAIVTISGARTTESYCSIAHKVCSFPSFARPNAASSASQHTSNAASKHTQECVQQNAQKIANVNSES